MTGLSAMGGVGAGLSQVQFQVRSQGQGLKEQRPASSTLGAVALELMRSAMTISTGSGAQGHDLDVKA